MLEPANTPPPPPDVPGDHIALNCGGRIWVSDLDGGNLTLLFAGEQRFNTLFWSADGRWLLTKWLPRQWEPATALYLLAANGRTARLLTNDLGLQVWPYGWSPDGGTITFCALRADASPDSDQMPANWAIDVSTGETEPLPGIPGWSPDGNQLVYVGATSQQSGRDV